MAVVNKKAWCLKSAETIRLIRDGVLGGRDSNRGPSAYQTNALPLDQTGSLSLWLLLVAFIQRYYPLSSRLSVLMLHMFLSE